MVSARGEALALAIDAAPHIIKPDTRERLDIGGKEIRSVEDILDRGEELLRCGAELVVVSHDVTGDIAMTKDGSWEIRTSASVKSFKNLVGADDAFLAGILYKLAQEAPVTEAVQFGLAVGLASAKSDDKICQRMEQIEQETRSIGLREVGGGSREGP
ncbi:MAG TPA: hypothetical protein ENN96_01325 [Candidatus Acetothermia bacterium]|nr:hypothetical protein [Candidatus Acetothermia bacterium]